MASGRPIVCNIDIYDCPITANRLGIAKHFSSSKEYAEAIREIIDLPQKEYLQMCTRAAQTAKKFDYPVLAKEMANVLETC